jgi:hypothetical protein
LAGLVQPLACDAQKMTAIDEDGHTVSAVSFDYAVLDGVNGTKDSRDDQLWRERTETLAVVLQWLTAARGTVSCGQRVKALCLWLRPQLIDEDSLRQIAESAPGGCGRAALSHALLELQRRYGGHAPFQKASYLRDRFRRSRIASHQNRQEAAF